MTIKSKNPGIYQTLIAQLDKVARHIRQGSFRTKERYYEANKRFCRFLADHYHLQKLANVSGKHLTAYIVDMQERGKSASTIKTDLAAIRFYHDMMGQTKYRLPKNDELAVELEHRRFGQKDRTWSVREFNLFLVTAMADGRKDFAAIACLTWYAGRASTSASASTRPSRSKPSGETPSPSKARAASSAPYPSTRASVSNSKSSWPSRPGAISCLFRTTCPPIMR